MPFRLALPFRLAFWSVQVAVLLITASCSRSTGKGDGRNVAPKRVIEIKHQELGSDRNWPVRRARQQQDVWVKVVDANPLIYSYSTSGTLLQEDDVARENFKKLLVGANVRAPVEPTDIRGLPTEEQAFQGFAYKLLNYARTLREGLIQADISKDDAQTAIKRLQKHTEDAETKLKVEPHLLADSLVLKAYVEALFNEIPAADQPRNAVLATAAYQAIPGVVTWRSEIINAKVTPEFVQFEYPGSGSVLLQMAISNRLGNDYRPQRWTGSGIDVAELKPAYRPLKVSFGMGGVFGEQERFSLAKISASGTPDTFRVSSRRLKDFRYVPSTMLSWQIPVSTSVVVGPSLGLGLRGESLDQIDDATDLMLLVTVGYDWFRFSAGGAWTSDVVSVPDLDSLGRTTDPNVLSRADLDRDWRWVLALHLTP
jgi:hypothetical protein